MIFLIQLFQLSISVNLYEPQNWYSSEPILIMAFLYIFHLFHLFPLFLLFLAFLLLSFTIPDFLYFLHHLFSLLLLKASILNNPWKKELCHYRGEVPLFFYQNLLFLYLSPLIKVCLLFFFLKLNSQLRIKLPCQLKLHHRF